MNAFFDTSVLVPVFYGDHEHHAPDVVEDVATRLGVHMRFVLKPSRRRLKVA